VHAQWHKCEVSYIGTARYLIQHRPTRVVPDKGSVCVCVCVQSNHTVVTSKCAIMREREGYALSQPCKSRSVTWSQRITFQLFRKVCSETHSALSSAHDLCTDLHRSLSDICMNILNKLGLMCLCTCGCIMFFLPARIVFIRFFSFLVTFYPYYIDVRLSHLNKDYLLTVDNNKTVQMPG